MSTATLFKPLTGGRGDIAIYKLDPPYVEHPYQWGDTVKPDITHEYVAVSAVDLDFGGFFSPGDYRTSETMIFPADTEAVTDWGALAMVPYKSHVDALKDLGYEIA